MVNVIVQVLLFFVLWFLFNNLIAWYKYHSYQQDLNEKDIPYYKEIIISINLSHLNDKYHKETFNLEEKVLGVSLVDTNPNNNVDLGKRTVTKFGLVIIDIVFSYDIFLIQDENDLEKITEGIQTGNS